MDPFYLAWKAREYDYHTRLIETSGEINTGMPEYVVDRAMKVLNKNKIAMNGAKVLVLGVEMCIRDRLKGVILSLDPRWENWNKRSVLIRDGNTV